MHEDNFFINDFIKLNFLMSRDKSSNLFESLLGVCLMMILPYIFDNIKKYITNSEWPIYNFNLQRKNTIIIEGKRSLRSSHWRFAYNNLFSDDFRALWYYINECSGFKNIYNIKAINGDEQDHEQENELQKKQQFYIVNQNTSFMLEKDIYCHVRINDNREDSEKLLEMHGQIDTITIELYSYNKTVVELKKYIEMNTQHYLDTMEKMRHNKKFIYTLENEYSGDEYVKKWMEQEYISYRSFDNMFFPQKNELLKKLQHFRDNKQEYDNNGDPYTLGICLYGPPGTGKTCIAKSIANMFGRHLVELPLDNIKTKSEFKKFFFESKYNKNNKSGSIGFDKKIILLEDIDCMSDIIFDREEKYNSDPDDKSTSPNNELIEQIVNVVSSDKKISNNAFTKNKDDITLSFILNLLDGVYETPGRIIIMTSNYIHKIDNALKRPGRIDIMLELTYVNMETIEEFYYHYYGKKIHKRTLITLNITKLTPAELVNIRRSNNNANDFIYALQNRSIQNDN